MTDHETFESDRHEILVVEDTPESLRLLMDILTNHGYRVRPALNGSLALRSASVKTPDMILLDVKMPNMDGYEVCRRLKADERTREIPVIFISALGETAEKIEGFKAGGVDYITKPFELEEVLARVGTHLHLRELTSRLEEKVHELQKTREELLLKERLAVLGNLAGSISHEIRNPLAAIDSSVYFLNMKLGDCDEKIREHLVRISKNVRKGTAIIESLLNLARMEKPVTQHYDLARFISETLDAVPIPEMIEVSVHFPGHPVFILADGHQIRMALENIIKNAVQAMDGAGKLTFSTNFPETGQVELGVADTGPGIPPEHIEKIFEPLFTTKARGIGFGLSITKMIIENHGGTIRAETKPETGAGIIISLPLAPREISNQLITTTIAERENRNE
ncbi:response regulator [Desulfobacterales bacterium HSG2]|nr:response regulator [Desulfobacterales bacterium HSG2]